MRALVLNCTLKPAPEVSNTEALARVLMRELELSGCDTELVRLVDLDIKPGVKTDQGRGDACPRCASYRLQPTGGIELKVRELIVHDH